MRWLRRKWWLLALAFSIAAFAIWRSRGAPPEVTFLRFETDGAGAKVATFQIQNRSRTVIYFAGRRLATGELQADVNYKFETPEKGQAERNYPLDTPYFFPSNEVQPYETKRFTVPLDFEDGVVISTPFKIGLRFWQRPPDLYFRLARWKALSDRFAPAIQIRWSDMVAQ